MAQTHAPSKAAAEPASSVILSKIIEKERELEQSIILSQEASNRTIQVAKEQAAAIIAEHRKAAEAEAAAVRQSMLDNARKEAAKIRAASDEKVQAFRKFPEATINEAVSRLLEMVLPSERLGG